VVTTAFAVLETFRKMHLVTLAIKIAAASMEAAICTGTNRNNKRSWAFIVNCSGKTLQTDHQLHPSQEISEERLNLRKNLKLLLASSKENLASD